MDFSIKLNCRKESFKEILSDYENIGKYLPRQLTEVRIVERNENNVKIEATIMFKTLIKKEIKQKVKIEESVDDFIMEVLDGHAKDTKMRISIVSENNQIIVNFNGNLKLSLKAKILSPIINREYKTLLKGVLAKIELDAIKNDEGKL